MPFPLVFTAHAKFSATPAKRFFTRPPSYTIAVSEDIKRHFSSRFSAKSVEVIENGIDVERFSPRQVQKSGFRNSYFSPQRFVRAYPDIFIITQNAAYGKDCFGQSQNHPIITGILSSGNCLCFLLRLIHEWGNPFFLLIAHS
jgi:glycosyltransferase involved in cell wall biosynthesis